jgi:hypothetical protein
MHSAFSHQAIACMNVVRASRIRSYVALTLLLASAALGCAVSSARAEAWGPGKAFPLAEPKPLFASGPVRPKFAAGTDGSYYVLTEDTSVREFVLQRFDEGKQQASVRFKRPRGAEETGKFGSEGVNATLAVDTSRERVYVLLVYERREATEAEENKVEFPLDDEMPAAGSLYAFEYDQTTKELLSRNTSKKEGPQPQLTREELKGQGESPKEALLDPRGMAVDPATGDLAISGNQDEESNSNVEAGGQKQCRAAVQFVTVNSGGKGELEAMEPGARYVDKEAKVLFGNKTGCGEEDEEEAINQAPASPVFAPDGTLLGYGEDEKAAPEEAEGIIWQLAPAGADKHAAGEVPMTPKELFVAGSVPAFEPYVGVAEEPDNVMSLVADEGGHSTTAGTIYLSGFQAGVTPGQPVALVLHYSDPTGSEPSIGEIGWTAGGANNAETRGPGPCDLHSTETKARIAIGGVAGSKRSLLAFTYYTDYNNGTHEVELDQGEVVQFGEGATPSGCPKAALSTPTQSYQNEPTHELPAGQPLEVTSELKTAGSPSFDVSAKNVTWTVRFTPTGGTTETKTYPQKYEFGGLIPEESGYGTELKLNLGKANSGVYEIVDSALTDDLGDEAAEASADKVTVKPNASEALAVKWLPGPAEVRAHEQEAQLTAEVLDEGKPVTSNIKRVTWEFGDGTKVEETDPPETLTSPLGIKHAFARCGTGMVTKCKITLKVEVELEAGKLQTVSPPDLLEITVRESEAEKKAEEEAAAKKKAEEEAAAKKKAEEEAAAKKKAEEEAAAKKAAEEAAAKKAREEAEAKAKTGVAGYIVSFAGSSLSVAANGSTHVTVTCPSGGSCSGVLTLRTYSAVAAAGKHGKKAIMTLAAGSFSLVGGSKSETLHLSSAALKLLRGSQGKLRAKLTVVSRGVGGKANNSTTYVVTVRVVAAKHHKG